MKYRVQYRSTHAGPALARVVDFDTALGFQLPPDTAVSTSFPGRSVLEPVVSGSNA